MQGQSRTLNGSAVFADYMQLNYIFSQEEEEQQQQQHQQQQHQQQHQQQEQQPTTTNNHQTTTNNQQPTNKERLYNNIFSHHHHQLRDPSCQDDLQKPKGGNATEGLRKSCTPQGAPDFSQKVAFHGAPLFQ